MPPKDLTWFTSDSPLIRLNYYRKNKYDFNGGWGRKGTELILPLSPHHLLYTRVGEKPPLRGTKVPEIQANLIRRFIAEHAYRFIFSHQKDLLVSKLRPRVVNRELFMSEKQKWKNWDNDNRQAEKDLLL